MTEPRGTIVPFDDLAHTEHAHGASRFDTEWLAGPDPAWTSDPGT
jgi:hypothetical protein